jgi:peptide/nickel transport system substrate-binding protein
MQQRMRKTQRLLTYWGCVMLGLGVVGAAVPSSPAAAASSVLTSHTLHLAFGADMQVPDPDIFYEIEGNAVMSSIYEGLVQYANGSTKIVPSLATAWTVSPDGMTYTFTLRTGVTFHDGTPFNSAAAAFSFSRRTGVNSAPAYMLADVTSTATPDPQTFVVHLDKPVSAFLDYLAAPYGPKMVSPTLVQANEVGGNPGDWAQGYLKTHDAGTGPYQISDFVPGSHYTLTAYPGYWGTKPYYTSIDINIVPDISTQEIELQNGQLSMSLHGLPVNAVSTFNSNPSFVVKEFPVQLKSMLYVNPNVGIFKSAAVRTALRSAINKKAIVASVYGNQLATVSTQAYPVGEFPKNLALDNPTYDPSKLTAALKKASGSKTVTLAYSTDDPNNQRVAEFVQTELSAAGLNVSLHGVPIAQAFNYASTPASQVPNLFIWTVNPDDSHPDSWIRIFSNTNGSLNELHGSVPAADQLMDAGLHSTDPATIQKDYAQAGTLVANSGEWISIADVRDTVVGPKGMVGFYTQPPMADTVMLGLLHPSSSK